LLRRNTRGGSRRNIGAHYDLSNEFFAAFLDDTLTYSCAVFERPGASLKEASLAKYERICRLADLSGGHEVLEIGTGWGGFALYAAERYGCRVTTTTISREQFALATRRVADAGLADRVRVLDKDYRDLTGRYDRLVSIEMIEAVGPQFLPTFFERCAALLVPEGRMALQAITIRDDQYDAARRETDFIKRHIFPGGTIFSLTALSLAASRTDLRLLRADDIGPHYAETLRRWRANLRASWPGLLARGFDERLLRLWEFYFCYCEGGFAEGYLGDVQLAFARPGAVAARTLWAAREGEAA
jgi:cyclopropane-fatty-acyl-phospholipid synthase